ncbi:unnamed protein product [Eruca vesicaria subsp. sativa]|uniref:Uncharacterized protein n=1 Tax=Eruca vesicaria subsp. sativa TaxID=29727 RepID=A0ABC8L690_ERUVS|nr:unnamed protein product [Eruca vesicaria subsp. sativa]
MDYTGHRLKKHNFEAEKRLKKLERDYLHTSQKYTETDSQFKSLHDERRHASNLFYSVKEFIDWCNYLVKKLQEALDKIPSTEETTGHLYMIQRKMTRSDSRRSVQSLLNEVKEKNKCKDKAVFLTCTLVCNPTNCDSLRKYVELEIKVLKKLIGELQKDREDKLQIMQYARNLYSDSKRKVKHVSKKKDGLNSQVTDCNLV